MKKIKQIIYICILACFINFFVSNTYCLTNNEVEIQSSINQKNYEVSPRENAINLLLNSDWTMAEINDLLTEKDMTVYENANKVIYDTNYIKISTNEFGEISTQEVTKSIYDYERNKYLLEENNSVDNHINKLGSNGKLFLTPLANTEGSVTANDDTNYLKQTISAVWMGNMKFSVSYRFEWLKTPNVRDLDIFAIQWDTRIGACTSQYEGFVYKYDLYGKTEECLTPVTWSYDTYGIYMCFNLNANANSSNHRGYMRTLAEIKNVSSQYSFYGKYMHAWSHIPNVPLISFEPNAMSNDTPLVVMGNEGIYNYQKPGVRVFVSSPN